eukprot:m.43721 g.43721  ORF g.43721 m.43721 type:complete len:100 (-) comp12053_c1_seq3:1587-1886(-)
MSSAEELLMLKQKADAAAEALIAKHSIRLKVRGKTLRVVHIRHREKDTPVLFFIHGLGGRLEQWEQQLVFFNQRVSIVAVDLRFAVQNLVNCSRPAGDF